MEAISKTGIPLVVIALLADVPVVIQQHVALFLGDEVYVSVVAVCRRWNMAWDLPKITRGVTDGMSLRMLVYAFSSGLRPHDRFSNQFARRGDVEKLKCAVNSGCGANAETCAIAARHGHLPVIQFLRSKEFGRKKCRWADTTITQAALGGHLDIVKWAYDNRCPRDDVAISIFGATGGHQNIIEWCRAEGLFIGVWTGYHAAENGHLRLLKDLHATDGCPMTERTCPWMFTKHHPQKVGYNDTNSKSSFSTF